MVSTRWLLVVVAVTSASGVARDGVLGVANFRFLQTVRRLSSRRLQVFPEDCEVACPGARAVFEDLSPQPPANLWIFMCENQAVIACMEPEPRCDTDEPAAEEAAASCEADPQCTPTEIEDSSEDSSQNPISSVMDCICGSSCLEPYNFMYTLALSLPVTSSEAQTAIERCDVMMAAVTAREVIQCLESRGSVCDYLAAGLELPTQSADEAAIVSTQLESCETDEGWVRPVAPAAGAGVGESVSLAAGAGVGESVSLAATHSLAIGTFAYVLAVQAKL